MNRFDASKVRCRLVLGVVCRLWRKRLPAAALMAILILTAFSAGCARTPAEVSIDELLSLGGRYLSELHYDQALAQFLQAIELEPRSVEAYLGAADAYTGMGQLGDAIAILERGIELTDDERLWRRLEALEDSMEPEEPDEPEPELTESEQALLEQIQDAMLALDDALLEELLFDDAFLALQGRGRFVVGEGADAIYVSAPYDYGNSWIVYWGRDPDGVQVRASATVWDDSDLLEVSIQQHTSGEPNGDCTSIQRWTDKARQEPLFSEATRYKRSMGSGVVESGLRVGIWQVEYLYFDGHTESGTYDYAELDPANQPLIPPFFEY